jgi:tRNA(Ile)-lysidine synthase
VPGVPPLVDQVEQFLRRQGIVHGGGVVAVSGGPDSVALLRALVALRPALLEGPLVVAHLNHQLRGGDSDADERFVRELHAALRAAGVADLGLRCDRADVAAQARKERGNLEGVARRLRYDWLAGVAREAGASWVATGHTADDQAETVLHRLLRGTGLKGLRGIAPRRRLTPGVEVVRPLLGVTRAEVLAYLEAENQPYRQDRSNLDLGYTRNRIRHELLPHLAARYNPAVVPILCRLAEQAAEAYRAAETRAADLLAEAELPRAGARLVFRADRLAAAPRHQVREMFRLVWVREGWPTGRLGFDGWDRLAALAFGEAVAVDLPGGVRAQRHGRVVQVKRTS